MKSAPAHIEAELKRYDPLLRIRWSREKGQFCVERKCDRRYIQRPVKYYQDGKIVKTRIMPEFSDRYECYRDGYTPILFTPYCDRRLLWAVFESDTFRMGKRFWSDSEYRFNKEEEKNTAKRQELFYETGLEAYEKMKWRTGERISFAGRT